MSGRKLRITDALICLKTETQREFRKDKGACRCVCVHTHTVCISVLFLKQSSLYVFQMRTSLIQTFALYILNQKAFNDEYSKK